MFLRLLLLLSMIVGAESLQFVCAGYIRGEEKLLPGHALPDLKIVIYRGGMDSICTSFIHEYKGKVILFDFWDVYCGTCIANMPHMLKLQNRFKDKLQIIVVARESPDKIAQMWRRYTFVSKIPSAYSESWKDLLFVTGDSSLNKIFPHFANPIHVWIDSNGIYKFSTHGINTTFKNVSDIIDGKVPDHLGKIEYGGDEASLMKSWAKKMRWGNEKPMFLSMMSKRVQTEAISGVRVIDRDSLSNKIVGVSYLNYSIIDLYTNAFAGILSGKSKIEAADLLDFNKRIIIKVQDREQYMVPPRIDSNYFEWADSNTFCYSISVPDGRADYVFKLMIDDLNRYFGLYGHLTYRYVRTFTIKLANVNLMNDISNEADKESVTGNIKFDKMSMRELGHYIKNGVSNFGSEYVDILTQGDEHRSLGIQLLRDSDFSSLDNVKRSLARCGLTMVEGKRSLEPFFIIDRGI